MTPPTLFEIAQEYTAAGISILPIRTDGSKAPKAEFLPLGADGKPTWAPFQSQIADPEIISQWLENGHITGLGAIGGAVSGGLEIIDFDAAKLFAVWCALVKAAGGGELLARFPVVQTPRGWHVYFRSARPEGNLKLARRAGESRPLIEKKGEGGYCLLPGCPPECHETGRPYILKHGSFSQIPMLTAEERRLLLDCAKTFDEMPRQTDREAPGKATATGGRPGDEFAAATTWTEILEPAAWKRIYSRGHADYWRRPGKNLGISGSTNHAGSGLLYVFSTSTAFEPERGYSKFSAYAILNHGGDFQAAARELSRKGFGTPRHSARAEAQPGAPTGESEPTAWPEPGELPQLLPEAPAMTPDFLPGPLREYLADISERKQIPLEIPSATAIVALAAVIGRKLGILPKRRDDWLVIVNLWGMVIARSGMMKSPGIAEALKPLGRLAADCRAQFEKARAENSAEVQVQEARIEAVRGEIRQAAKAKKDDRLEDLAVVLAELQTLAEEKKMAEKRIRVNDTTTEKLGELLRDNPNGLLLFRDELSGFLRALDRPGREGDREFYLESWEGTNSFTQDRIGRGTIHIPYNCLSLLGGIQPGKLERYINDAVAGKAGDDGLIQRFQIGVYPERRKTWRNVDEFPNHDARNRAYRIFENLHRMDPLAAGAKLPKYEKAPALNFADDAQGIFDAWLVSLQARICGEEIGSPEFESHLAKYRSLMPSLALIFHLVDWADSVIETAPLPALQPVSAESTKLAATWTEFLEAHARKVYAGLMRPDVQAAHALAKKIKTGKVKSGDPLRIIYRANWSLLQTREAVMGAVQTLAEADWLRIVTDHTGGRPTDILCLNPRLKGEK